MGNIFKSAMFKLVRDKTFIITLIIGVIVAALISIIIGSAYKTEGVGFDLLQMQASPVNNFGIAVPINLISLIVLEFTYGTIRNKVIAGYKKSIVYCGLFLVGLVFSLSLMLVYISLSVFIGSAICGFDKAFANIDGANVVKFLLMAICSYVFVTSLALFYATLVRSIGPAITLTVLTLMACLIIPIIVLALSKSEGEYIQSATVLSYLDPVFYLAMGSRLSMPLLSDAVLYTTGSKFLIGVFSPLIYAALFYFAGVFIFSKRDLK